MTTIITGANRGLGFETARVLASDESRRVLMAGRRMDELTAAAEILSKETGNRNVIPVELDLASMKSVREFVNRFSRSGIDDLESVICNAGLSFRSNEERSADGIEMSFAVNHLGHFLLVHLLLPYLHDAGSIVMVSSSVHDPEGRGGPLSKPRYVKAEYLAYPDRHPEPAPLKDLGAEVYSTSKLCNILFTYELDNRLKSAGRSGIRVNAYDPGLMAGTGLGRDEKGLMRFMWNQLLPGMSRLFGFGRSTREAARELADLVSAEEYAGSSGLYFSVGKETESSGDSYNPHYAADLWEFSARISGIKGI